MIKKIKITKGNKTIKKDFVVGELEKMTIIVGENNVGKSNFFREIDGKNIEFLDENDNEINKGDIEIIHIKSDNIQPSESELKNGATTNLIENLVKLFKTSGINLELKDNESENTINTLMKKITENLQEFSNNDEYKVECEIKNLIQKDLIRLLIGKIISKELGVERKLEELGQGMQRIIIASVLRAYLDIKIEKGVIDKNKKILILFDEPEVFLHPNFKRSLNNTLEKLSKEDNIQIIISTHDPYFSFLNLDDGKKIISFIKNNGITEISKDGINGMADELLFISLYGKLKKEKKGIVDMITLKIDSFRKYSVYKDGIHGETKGELGYIRDQIHHKADNKNTEGLVSIKRSEEIENSNSLEINYFTEEELNSAIKKMSEELFK